MSRPTVATPSEARCRAFSRSNSPLRTRCEHRPLRKRCYEHPGVRASPGSTPPLPVRALRGTSDLTTDRPPRCRDGQPRQPRGDCSRRERGAAADVVADRLGTHSGAHGDLLGRVSSFEQLSTSACRGVRWGVALAAVPPARSDLTEDPTIRSPFLSGTGELERHPRLVGPQENPLGLCDRDRTDDLAREDLACATGLLRRDHRG